MGSHPINLGLRFLLEVAALVAFGAWGWETVAGVTGWMLAAGLPLAAATAWGVFAVPGDPSRSGAAPVPVPGLVRLLLEIGFFLAATACLRSLGWETASATFAVLVVLHYGASLDRLTWLLRQ